MDMCQELTFWIVKTTSFWKSVIRHPGLYWKVSISHLCRHRSSHAALYRH
jgi:hypothetical protein